MVFLVDLLKVFKLGLDQPKAVSKVELTLRLTVSNPLALLNPTPTHCFF